MARIRSIHPGMASDEAYMSMSMAAKAAWPLLWTECDDHGAFEWKPIVLKARIFPADNVDFAELLEEYARLGCVMRVEIEGKPVGLIRNFCKFQSPKKPRYRFTLTPPMTKFVGDKTDNSPTGTEPVPHQDVTGTEKPRQREEEVGEGRGKDNSSQPTVPRDELDTLEAALRKAAGAQNNPSPKLFDLSPILKLIDSGVSLERVIIPKLKGLAAAGKNFRSWQYPAQIITDELAEQGRPVKPSIEDDEKWKSRLGHGRNRKIWAVSDWGPLPGQPGCRVPAHLLERGDGDGWVDWKPEKAA